MKPLSDRLTDRELISRGDLSLAYRARDSVLDRTVFVKALNPALAKDAEIRARFEREAKAVARLDHPNLVRIYEYGEDPEYGLCMVLEWLEGSTLASRIKSGGKWSGGEFVELARQLLSGLAALHSVGILHRDLKPDNILITAAGTPKITDFSLASLRDAPKLTHHEAIVGTPAYMSPEQAAGGVPGESSDLFSLGVVLWEAATGESPFLAKTVIETLRNVRERELAFDHPAITALPIEAQTLLRGLLEKDTDKRIPTAAAALSVLEGAAPPERRTDSARRNRLYLAAAALVVAIWAVLMFRGPKEEPIPASSDSTSVAVRSARSLPPPTDLRAPSSGESDSVESAVPVEEQTDRTPVASERDMTATRTDSVLLYLTTEPWAHVYVDGVQLGTTPLAQPLRLPAGQQEITLRNPAYPPIELPLTLEDSICYRRASLAEYVGLVRLSVVPWGELYLDGEHVGTSPLTRPLFVSPGRHTLRISHPQLAALQQDVTVAPGETLAVDADLAQSHLSVKAEGGGSRQ